MIWPIEIWGPAAVSLLGPAVARHHRVVAVVMWLLCAAITTYYAIGFLLTGSLLRLVAAGFSSAPDRPVTLTPVIATSGLLLLATFVAIAYIASGPSPPTGSDADD